jgi:hypothetical protein
MLLNFHLDFNDYCMAQGIEVQHSVLYDSHTKWFGRISDKENQANC